MNLPDISIIELLPPNLARDKNVRMACEAFDEELRRIIIDIPKIAVMPNLVRKQITDNLLLDLLAWQFHCDFYDVNFPVEKKQEIILKSLDWHTRKGTPSVVEEVVSTVFSRANTQEWFEYGGLPYRFRVETDEELPDTEAINKLTRLINSVKNTRSILEKITETNYFYDEIIISECLRLIVRRRDYESAGNPIKFNGAVKFDGVTQNQKIRVHGKFDGKGKFNGDMKFNGTRKTDNLYPHTPPFKFSSGIKDVLDITFKNGNLVDTQRARLCFDGSVRFDGSAKFNGVSPHAVNDALIRMESEHTMIENTPPIIEALKAAAVANEEEDTKKSVKFDGKIKFNGKHQFTNDYADQIGMDVPGNNLSDNVEVNENVFVGIRKHHHFDGTYKFDGSIKFDGMALIPMG